MTRERQLDPAALGDLWSLSIARAAPVVPYLMLVLVLAVHPRGLMGTREA
jgi:branched-chain amino acid transport system permease protein